MSRLEDIRRQYPQYSDLSDAELASALHRRFYSDLPQEQVFRRLGVAPTPTPVPTPVPTPTPRPAPAEAPEDEGILSTLGRAAARGVPVIRRGLAQIVEDAPEIAGSLLPMIGPSTPIGRQVAESLGRAAAESELYKNLTGGTVESQRRIAEERLAELGPRRFGGFFEEEGLGRLGSLAETVAESALPVVAGLGTALATRSPVAAGAVMTGGSVPMTYGGIRERQEEEGIDDVQRAVAGTAASSALDILTGVGGQVLSSAAAVAARELLEGGLRQAIARTARSGATETGTEMLQNVIEQVAGGSDPTTKQAMLETLEAGLAGALGGTVFTATGEAVTAPFRPGADGVSPLERRSITRSPEYAAALEAEKQRLFEAEREAVRAANPGASFDAIFDTMLESSDQRTQQAEQNALALVREQRAQARAPAAEEISNDDPEVVRAFNSTLETLVAEVAAANPNASREEVLAHVNNYAPLVLEEAKQQVAAARGGAGGRPTGAATPEPRVDVGGVPGPVGGGTITGVSPVVSTELPGAGVAPAGDIVGGGVGQPVAGATVPDVGAGAQPRSLTAITEAPTLKERRAAAAQLVSDITMDTPELQALPKKVYTQAANQMATAATRGEAFDPVDIMYKVAGLERPAPAPTITSAVEPAPVPATPAVEPAPAATMVEPGVTPPTAVQEELEARDQEVSQELVAPEVQPTPTVAETATAAPEPEVFIDNPGGDWLARKQQRAQQEQAEALEKGETIGTAARMLSGSTTQTIRRVEVPVEKLRTLEGVRGEQPEPGQPKYDALRKSVDEKGFDREEAGLPMVFVNHNGEAFIYEGNNRVAVAAEEGVKSLPVEVQYINGAEAAPGPFAPDQVLAEHRALTSPQVAPEAAPEVAPEAAPEPVTDTTAAQAVSKKLTKAEIRKAQEAAGIRRAKLSSMQKRISRSRKTQETLSLSGKLALMARGRTRDIGLLASLFNSVSPPLLQKALGPMQTEDVVRIGTMAGLKNPERIDRLMREQYLPYVNARTQKAADLSERWADFSSRHEEGARALSDVMFISTMYDVNPMLAPNPTEYAKIDPAMQETEAALASAKDPKKIKALKAQRTKRLNEIRRVYFGGADKDSTTIYGWNDLSTKEMGSGEAKRIYREAHAYHRDDFNEHYRILIQRIDDGGFDEVDADVLKQSVDDMFAEARKRATYFPLRRYGEYWVSVGKGKDAEFHLFESMSAQDTFLKQLKADNDPRTVSSGYGTSGLRGNVANRDASAALKNLLEAVESGGVTDTTDLKDHIFQMYLTVLPEADIRRRFMHRNFKTGFSTDTLRAFSTTALASTQQLARLAFKPQFENLIDQGRAETEELPNKRSLDVITNEMEFRVRDMLSPAGETGLDRFLAATGKATFLFLLSSPKSALMNLTQLHIVGLPTLSAEFGEKATYAMAAKYTAGILTGQRIANPFRDKDGNVGLQMPTITLENNANMLALKESDPERYEALTAAWEYAALHDVTQSTFSAASDFYDRTDMPTETYGFVQSLRRGEPISAAQRATANAVNAMGALFHGTERIGREVMYMSSFELAYDRQRAKGVSNKKAIEVATREAAELTNKGMFDFSGWNKSRYAKHPAGRLALQMRSYSIAMTSLMFRSFARMLPFFNKEGKVAAAKVFFGVGGMTALYGGFRATQLYGAYSLAMGAYGLLQYVLSLGDEEEELTPETIEEELLKYADEQGNELGRKDMEFYLRTSWIPSTFGPGGTLATAFGIPDGAAEMLSTAADMGIPALFGVDLSNSVSLADLWHPVTVKSDDPEVRMFEGLSRLLLGASSSMPVAAVKFLKEANAGNFERAIETGLPAILRNYVKSERLQEEGLVVGSDRDIVLRDPDFYDTYTSMMQALGFAEAQSSREMQLSIAAGDIERQVAAERTDVLNRAYQANLAFERDPSDENLREIENVERAVEVYNLNYPSNAITADTLRTSYREKAREAAERAGGMGVNPRIPVRQPLVEERLREEAQE